MAKWFFAKGQHGNFIEEGDLATTTTAGVVKKAANVAGAAGSNVTKAEFKALLDALIAAGLMEAASPQ